MDAGVIAGMVTLAIGQIATLWRLSMNYRNARNHEADVAERAANALAVAAKLVDERTTRDRQWLLEDRKALAVELASKVQATADALALKVAADNAEVASVNRAHAAELALQTRHDQLMLATTVQKAEGVAITAVDALTALVLDNTAKTEEGTLAAKAAYQEANHVNVKIEHLAEAGLIAAEKPTPWDPASPDRRAPTP